MGALWNSAFHEQPSMSVTLLMPELMKEQVIFRDNETGQNRVVRSGITIQHAPHMHFYTPEERK